MDDADKLRIVMGINNLSEEIPEQISHISEGTLGNLRSFFSSKLMGVAKKDKIRVAKSIAIAIDGSFRFARAATDKFLGQKFNANYSKMLVDFPRNNPDTVNYKPTRNLLLVASAMGRRLPDMLKGNSLPELTENYMGRNPNGSFFI